MHAGRALQAITRIGQKQKIFSFSPVTSAKTSKKKDREETKTNEYQKF